MRSSPWPASVLPLQLRRALPLTAGSTYCGQAASASPCSEAGCAAGGRRECGASHPLEPELAGAEHAQCGSPGGAEARNWARCLRRVFAAATGGKAVLQEQVGASDPPAEREAGRVFLGVPHSVHVASGAGLGGPLGSTAVHLPEQRTLTSDAVALRQRD